MEVPRNPPLRYHGRARGATPVDGAAEIAAAWAGTQILPGRLQRKTQEIQAIRGGIRFAR
jgi:hypothetical protein